MNSQSVGAATMPAVDREEAIAILRELIRGQASGEAAVQSAVSARLAALGGEVELISYEPADVPLVNEFAAETNITHGARESVVAKFAGQGGGRSLILFAHPDGEPLADAPAWAHDRFAGVRRAWAALWLGRRRRSCGRRHGGCRNDGSPRRGRAPRRRRHRRQHAEQATRARRLRGSQHGYTADGAIYLHPAESGVGMREIKAFASGQLEFSIVVTGKRAETTEPGHTAFAHRAVNPLDKVLPIIAALKALDAERGSRVHHPRLEAAIGRSTNILLSSVQFGGTRAFSRLADRVDPERRRFLSALGDAWFGAERN